MNSSLNRMRSGLSHHGFDWQIDAEAQDHEVIQVLCHCLLNYHCVQNKATQLPQVIKQLMLLRDKLQQDNWRVKHLLDVFCKVFMWCKTMLKNHQPNQPTFPFLVHCRCFLKPGLMILEEVAKSNMLCLRTLLNLHLTQIPESLKLHKKVWSWNTLIWFNNVLVLGGTVKNWMNQFVDLMGCSFFFFAGPAKWMLHLSKLEI